jgi:SAM-dependent methyltransferase
MFRLFFPCVNRKKRCHDHVYTLGSKTPLLFFFQSTNYSTITSYSPLLDNSPKPSHLFHQQTSDEDSLDGHSLFDGQSLIDSNLSFASSVRDYCYENGRRYHAYRHGQYPIPNDQEEQDRLALLHHLFKLVAGGDLYRAPIQPREGPTPPHRILDIGTGTAEWAFEIAEDFPNAEVIGTDLSPIQPSWAPPNCRFYIDDAESDWAFTPEEQFDFIHMRSMGGGIGDWPRLMKQAYQHLRPGGWIEVQEFETAISSDDDSHLLAPTMVEWVEKVNDAARLFGKPMNIASQIHSWMENGGFVNVTDDIYKVCFWFSLDAWLGLCSILICSCSALLEDGRRIDSLRRSVVLEKSLC